MVGGWKTACSDQGPADGTEGKGGLLLPVLFQTLRHGRGPADALAALTVLTAAGGADGDRNRPEKPDTAPGTGAGEGL